MAIEVLVETRPDASGDLAARPRLPEALSARIDEVADAVLQVTSSLKQRLDGNLDREPEPGRWHLGEVEMTFSLDLEAEAGVVISRISTSAGFEVKLTWSRPLG
jgi:hypothetical protein